MNNIQSDVLMKPYYVYELVDPRNNEVFYVGKGTGQRALQHELDALNLNENSTKFERIRKISESSKSLVIRVIGRYKTEEQALSVEATLIHWVYGFDNLTNIQGGHGCSSIRNLNDLRVIEGIDIPKPERRADGVYTQAMKDARESHGTISFVCNVKEWLEQQLGIIFSEPDIAESNKTKIYTYFNQARIRVGVTHSKEPSLWIALEPINNSIDAQIEFVKVSKKLGLVIRKNNKIARLQNYRGTKNLDILLKDIKALMEKVNNN